MLKKLEGKEYETFVEKGEVTPERVSAISEKIKTKEKLSKEEQAVYETKTKEIEGELQKSVDTEIKEVKAKEVEIVDQSLKASSLEQTQEKLGVKEVAKVKVEDVEKMNKENADVMYKTLPIAKNSMGSVFGFDTSHEAMSSFVAKYFKKEGHLPAKVFDRHMEAEGKINSVLKDVEFTTKDFKKAIKENYKDFKESDLEKINEVLGNLGTENRSEVLRGLPESMRPVVNSMRNQIDKLSRELGKAGATEGLLDGKIQDNLGYYLTRSYKVHNDPKKWNYENVPDKVKNKAVEYLRDSFPEYSETQIDNTIRELLDKPDMPLGIVKSGKLGSKDLGNLKKRSTLLNESPEIRALLGEYTDPLYNYATSVAKLTHLVEKQKFLNDVKDMGMGEFLFEGTEKNIPSGNFRKIAAEGASTMNPLNGLYTTPEIAEAFANFSKTEPLPNYIRQYMKVNSAAKYAKTIGSAQTHVRNYLSNYGFHLANGRVFQGTGELGKAHKAIVSDVKARTGDREYIKRLHELNIIGEGIHVNDLRETMKDGLGTPEQIESHGDNIFKKIKNKTLKTAEKAYQIEDDVHKIYAFEFEKNAYRPVIEKQNKGKSEAEIERLTEEKAAEVVRSTMPTYSLIPKGIQELRRFPLAGTFVSFPWEVMRTSYNTIDLARKELKDPETRSIGARRVGGMMAAATLTAGAASLSRNINGISNDEDKDIRRFLAPWSANSQLIYTKDAGSGKYSYIDAGYSDSHALIKKLFIPLIKKADDKEFNEAIIESLKEFSSPFLSEELLYSKVLDIQRNSQKDSGKPIYNPTESAGQKWSDMRAYLWKGIEPGTITSLSRINKAFQDRDEEEGRGYTPSNEIAALLTGQRVSQVDVGRSFNFKLYRKAKEIEDSKRIYTKLLYDDKTSAKDKLEAKKRAEDSLEEIFEELHEDYNAASRLGVDETSLLRSIKNLRVSNNVRRSIVNGEFMGIEEYSGKIY